MRHLLAGNDDMSDPGRVNRFAFDRQLQPYSLIEAV
jgi:hypothetical protein